MTDLERESLNVLRRYEEVARREGELGSFDALEVIADSLATLRAEVARVTAQLAAERERCAKVCLKVADECHNDDGFRAADVCADAIRALPAPEAT